MSELICTKCGAPLQNNSLYCSKCGATVSHPVKIEVSEKILAKRAKDEAKREENRIKRQTPAYKKMQKIVGITVPCSVIVVALLLVFLLAPIQASAMGYDISLDNSGGIEIDIYNNKTENPEIPEEMWYLGAMRPVTSIGSAAFNYCTSLTSIVIPDSVTTIDGYAFNRCTSLTSVVIPDSVTTIGSYAFEDCDSLTSIVIPDSVTTIGDGAFAGCISWMNVFYTGTEEEWNQIVIRYGNEALENATIHYNYIPEQN